MGMLPASAVSPASRLAAATGQERYKRIGLMGLKWVVLAGLGFFAVLILERVA